jgi:hypothetical protein
VREREERKDERVIATEDSLKKLTGENCEWSICRDSGKFSFLKVFFCL